MSKKSRKMPKKLLFDSNHFGIQQQDNDIRIDLDSNNFAINDVFSGKFDIVSKENSVIIESKKEENEAKINLSVLGDNDEINFEELLENEKNKGNTKFELDLGKKSFDANVATDILNIGFSKEISEKIAKVYQLQEETGIIIDETKILELLIEQQEENIGWLGQRNAANEIERIHEIIKILQAYGTISEYVNGFDIDNIKKENKVWQKRDIVSNKNVQHITYPLWCRLPDSPTNHTGFRTFFQVSPELVVPPNQPESYNWTKKIMITWQHKDDPKRLSQQIWPVSHWLIEKKSGEPALGTSQICTYMYSIDNRNANPNVSVSEGPNIKIVPQKVSTLCFPPGTMPFIIREHSASDSTNKWIPYDFRIAATKQTKEVRIFDKTNVDTLEMEMMIPGDCMFEGESSMWFWIRDEDFQGVPVENRPFDFRNTVDGGSKYSFEEVKNLIKNQSENKSKLYVSFYFGKDIVRHSELPNVVYANSTIIVKIENYLILREYSIVNHTPDLIEITQSKEIITIKVKGKTGKLSFTINSPNAIRPKKLESSILPDPEFTRRFIEAFYNLDLTGSGNDEWDENYIDAFYNLDLDGEIPEEEYNSSFYSGYYEIDVEKKAANPFAKPYIFGYYNFLDEHLRSTKRGPPNENKDP